MEVSKTISGVEIRLTLVEAQELHAVIGLASSHSVAYALYHQLGHVLDDAEANGR